MTASIAPHRLTLAHTVAIRAVRGPLDLEVVLRQAESGLTLGVLRRGDSAVQEIPFPHATLATTVTADGAFILELDDEHGSELGHLHAYPVAGGPGRDLTPHQSAYTIRGIDCSLDGRHVLVTAADETGFSVMLTSLERQVCERIIFHSPNEAWSGILSADSTLAAIDTTDHNPGRRRFAVTVVSTETGEVLAELSDGVLGPVRAVRFAQESGDGRVLAYSEVTGFARPLIWNPISGTRIDIPLEDCDGDVIPLDWHSPTGMILLVHIDRGVHRILEHDLETSTTHEIQHPSGAFYEPDVGSEFPVLWASHYSWDGALRLVRGTWSTPLHIIEGRDHGRQRIVLPPDEVPPGTELTSHDLVSEDGTVVQLWVGLPNNAGQVRGTILEVHGGPNLVTVDRYDPIAQSWIDDGWVYASLNYRGSVTFGREFREKFWGRVGEGELQDISAALDWLSSRGLASATSTFITGPSYGGYLTLLAMGRIPQRLAGGLAHVAQADWVTAYEDMNPALQAAWRGFIGSDPTEDVEQWRHASPISYVDKVRSPVWLNQGMFDSRTPPRQAQQYADALRDRGGDVLIDWFSGGHMPTGLDGLQRDYRRMRQLTDRALAGLRWDAAAEPNSPVPHI